MTQNEEDSGLNQYNYERYRNYFAQTRVGTSDEAIPDDSTDAQAIIEAITENTAAHAQGLHLNQNLSTDFIAKEVTKHMSPVLSTLLEIKDDIKTIKSEQKADLKELRDDHKNDHKTLNDRILQVGVVLLIATIGAWITLYNDITELKIQMATKNVSAESTDTNIAKPTDNKSLPKIVPKLSK